MFLFLLGLAVGAALLPLLTENYLTNIVLVLHDGQSYSRALEQIVPEGYSAFLNSHDATIAMLTALIKPDDIVKGFVAVRSGKVPSGLETTAQILAQHQTTLAEVPPRLPNVFEPPDTPGATLDTNTRDDMCCVVGIVLVASQAPLRAGAINSGQLALSSLNGLAPTALRFYFVPRFGRPLARSAALSTLEYVRGEPAPSHEV